MNERLQELFVKAYGYVPLPIEDHISPEMEKFAELIIQECIKLNRQELAFNAFERMLNLYKEHFGVEL